LRNSRETAEKQQRKTEK